MPEVVTSCWMPSFSVQVAVKRGREAKWVIEWRKWTVVHKVQLVLIVGKSDSVLQDPFFWEYFSEFSGVFFRVLCSTTCTTRDEND